MDAATIRKIQAMNSSKSVFVIGSLIIIFLVGDSKALTSESSPASEVYYDEYVSVSRNLWSLSGHEEKGEMKGEKFFEEKRERAWWLKK
ncbi:unnamed protein product, partial [Vitis vinifera]|uniref:Uncharacterized protein n=1 Tax=Vitis vinifera TaxID=29760 RepID=D7SH17_VITVI